MHGVSPDFGSFEELRDNSPYINSNSLPLSVLKGVGRLHQAVTYVELPRLLYCIEPGEAPRYLVLNNPNPCSKQ